MINKKQVSDALALASAVGNDRVHLYCSGTKAIPYVKREVLRILGEPNSSHDYGLYYPGMAVYVLPMSSDMIDPASGYYVGWEDGKDVRYLQLRGIPVIDGDPKDFINMWKSLDLGPKDMVDALVVEGYLEDEAIDLVCQGIV